MLGAGDRWPASSGTFQLSDRRRLPNSPSLPADTLTAEAEPGYSGAHSNVRQGCSTAIARCLFSCIPPTSASSPQHPPSQPRHPATPSSTAGQPSSTHIHKLFIGLQRTNCTRTFLSPSYLKGGNSQTDKREKRSHHSLTL